MRHSLYRAIDRDGTLVDSMLSGIRDMAAATRFLVGAAWAVGRCPKQVTTDWHAAYLGPALITWNHTALGAGAVIPWNPKRVLPTTGRASS